MLFEKLYMRKNTITSNTGRIANINNLESDFRFDFFVLPSSHFSVNEAGSARKFIRNEPPAYQGERWLYSAKEAKRISDRQLAILLTDVLCHNTMERQSTCAISNHQVTFRLAAVAYRFSIAVI